MTVHITATPDPPMVEVRLSDAAVERECAGDVIADVNRSGSWIRGLELLGTAGFSLERALAPFDPKPRAGSVRSAQAELTVTYDPEGGWPSSEGYWFASRPRGAPGLAFETWETTSPIEPRYFPPLPVLSA